MASDKKIGDELLKILMRSMVEEIAETEEDPALRDGAKIALLSTDIVDLLREVADAERVHNLPAEERANLMDNLQDFYSRLKAMKKYE